MAAISTNTSAAANTGTAGSVRQWVQRLKSVLQPLLKVLIAIDFDVTFIPIRYDDANANSLVRALSDQLAAHLIALDTKKLLADESQLEHVKAKIARARERAIACKHDQTVMDAAAFIINHLNVAGFVGADDLVAFVSAFGVNVNVLTAKETSVIGVCLYPGDDGVNIARFSSGLPLLNTTTYTIFVYSGTEELGIPCGFLSARPLYILPRESCRHCGASFDTQYRMKRHLATHHFRGQFICDNPDCLQPYKADGSNMKQHEDEVHPKADVNGQIAPTRKRKSNARAAVSSSFADTATATQLHPNTDANVHNKKRKMYEAPADASAQMVQFQQQFPTKATSTRDHSQSNISNTAAYNTAAPLHHNDIATQRATLSQPALPHSYRFASDSDIMATSSPPFTASQHQHAITLPPPPLFAHTASFKSTHRHQHVSASPSSLQPRTQTYAPRTIAHNHHDFLPLQHQTPPLDNGSTNGQPYVDDINFLSPATSSDRQQSLTETNYSPLLSPREPDILRTTISENSYSETSADRYRNNCRSSSISPLRQFSPQSANGQSCAKGYNALPPAVSSPTKLGSNFTTAISPLLLDDPSSQTPCHTQASPERLRSPSPPPHDAMLLGGVRSSSASIDVTGLSPPRPVDPPSSEPISFSMFKMKAATNVVVAPLLREIQSEVRRASSPTYPAHMFNGDNSSTGNSNRRFEYSVNWRHRLPSQSQLLLHSDRDTVEYSGQQTIINWKIDAQKYNATTTPSNIPDEYEQQTITERDINF